MYADKKKTFEGCKQTSVRRKCSISHLRYALIMKSTIKLQVS